MRATYILIPILAVCLVGCAASPNLVNVTKGGITAHGTIFGVFKKHEQIDLIEINPRKLSDDERKSLWVGLSSTNQIAFSEITEAAIKRIGIPATNFYSAANPESYFLCGYNFDFKDGEFVGFTASIYGNPPKDIVAFVKLGSLRSGSSLSFPCSVDDFEKVFGKADSINRYFSW